MRLKHKYTHRVVLYISIALFISYFVLTSVPKFDTEENKIYFKITLHHLICPANHLLTFKKWKQNETVAVLHRFVY